ncbi:MAG: hypothetical protein EVG15_00765 [Candidatus Acididesulfobacter diazotrophicus]|uniref:Uncharacterized protein n=1 Tax=Candidatus Acididesulfobacter diazotrophicus TaxID=2597226 RepID=A0A519BQ90_9DELT|nr:MAG: hypothetical protein EVG15_00765 [Candidatus Acididesulfobacter diazotrophicus]
MLINFVSKVFKHKPEKIKKLRLSGIIGGNKELIDLIEDAISHSEKIRYDKKFDPNSILTALGKALDWHATNIKNTKQ